MTVGTKNVKRINCVLAVVRKYSRSTWEGKAAEVCGGTGTSQDHTEHPARVSLELLLGGKESWFKPFISVQLILLLTLGRMFFQLGFCFPQGGASQSPAPSSAPAGRLGMLLSSWATTVFPAGIRGDPHSEFRLGSAADARG